MLNDLKNVLVKSTKLWNLQIKIDSNYHKSSYNSQIFSQIKPVDILNIVK